MDDRIPALVFGVCLVIGGTAALIWHVRVWRVRRADVTASAEERRYYRRQFVRRLQTSGLIVVIGVLLPVGDGLIPKETWKDHPGWFAAYWSMVLALALWVMAMGFGDLLSTRIHSRDALGKLRKLREQQRELEREIAQIRAGGKSPPPQL
jgi:peptidoglycan/LPS O-acetylase OafA/YrhL